MFKCSESEVYVLSVSGGCWWESYKLCHRITFQTLMIFLLENREQITADLIVSHCVYHVSDCNQEMLYLYYHWFNKRASFENIRVHHYNRGSKAFYYDTLHNPNSVTAAAYCLSFCLNIFLSLWERDGGLLAKWLCICQSWTLVISTNTLFNLLWKH